MPSNPNRRRQAQSGLATVGIRHMQHLCLRLFATLLTSSKTFYVVLTGRDKGGIM